MVVLFIAYTRTVALIPDEAHLLSLEGWGIFYCHGHGEPG